MKKKKPLSLKIQKFCLEYVKDPNGTQAAIRAGYSKKTATMQASRLLTKDEVKAFIAAKMAPVEKKALVDAEYVVAGLKEVFERCMQRKPVMVRERDRMVQKKEERINADGDLVEEGVWEFDSSGANKSAELLGRYLQLFVDKSEVKTDGPISITVVPATGNNGKPSDPGH